jgi:hypothetical protein
MYIRQITPLSPTCAAGYGSRAIPLGSGRVRDIARWLDYPQAMQTEAEFAALRRSVERGAPLGAQRWVKRTATVLGLESSLNPPDRPPKRRGRTAKPEVCRTKTTLHFPILHCQVELGRSPPFC